jgi:hypothetical protein
VIHFKAAFGISGCLTTAHEMNDERNASYDEEKVYRTACDMERSPSNQPANPQHEKQH